MYDHMTSPVNINGTVTTPPRSSVASGTCTTEFTIAVPASFSGEMTWAPHDDGVTFDLSMVVDSFIIDPAYFASLL